MYFVGTSGWSYDWNPDGFRWYHAHSGLNAVELNASFYRFPFRSMVSFWSKFEGMRWSIKVHRSITHRRRLKESSYEMFSRFKELFDQMDGKISFYLFQLPPSVEASGEFWERISSFSSRFDLGPRMAVEWRNLSWFKEEWVDAAREEDITVVSVDSPEFLFYARSSKYTYLRMHGRSFWYSHRYTEEELSEVRDILLSLDGEEIYVFFNNDHDMLDNAREMLRLLRRGGA